jgi:Ca2+-binding RTX toxin-like protein
MLELTRSDPRSPSHSLRRLPLVTAVASLLLAVALPEAEAAVPKCFGKPATIVGTVKGNDIDGTSHADVIVGLGGNDDIDGKGGGDRICGGKGKDDINGGGGKDMLDGGPGVDELTGGPGSDTCLNGEDHKSCEKFEFDGDWSGMTSQDNDFSFIVEENGVTSVGFIYVLEGAGCITVANGGTSFDDPVPIVNDQFTAEWDSGSTSFSVDGTFNSSDSASGDLVINSTSGCVGMAELTWDADKA